MENLRNEEVENEDVVFKFEEEKPKFIRTLIDLAIGIFFAFAVSSVNLDSSISENAINFYAFAGIAVAWHMLPALPKWGIETIRTLLFKVGIKFFGALIISAFAGPFIILYRVVKFLVLAIKVKSVKANSCMQ